MEEWRPASVLGPVLSAMSRRMLLVALYIRLHFLYFRLLESSRFNGARIDDSRIKRGQRVQGSFLGALQETCNN